MTNNLWEQLCSEMNLKLAFFKARKHKTLKLYVIEFESNLKENLLLLRTELLLHSYRPKPLETFILRDPKTRIINKSDFRDRIVHHALCNIINDIFEKSFIFDSYANRVGKGGLKAIEQFEHFSRKVSHNFNRDCFILKADIKHYFETVNHQILLAILSRKINEDKIIWLIKIILNNHAQNRDMPLGNLTSQFFANVYLNELDQFVKRELKAKHYIRYVDDFVILHHSKKQLQEWKEIISLYLQNYLKLELHPDKSKIIDLNSGVSFLGFKIFPHHRLLKRKNNRKFQRKYKESCLLYQNQEINYDNVYDFMEGWIAYAKHANTYKLRKKILAEFETKFANEISTKEVNRNRKKRRKNKSSRQSTLHSFCLTLSCRFSSQQNHLISKSLLL